MLSGFHQIHSKCPSDSQTVCIIYKMNESSENVKTHCHPEKKELAGKSCPSKRHQCCTSSCHGGYVSLAFYQVDKTSYWKLHQRRSTNTKTCLSGHVVFQCEVSGKVTLVPSVRQGNKNATRSQFSELLPCQVALANVRLRLRLQLSNQVIPINFPNNVALLQDKLVVTVDTVYVSVYYHPCKLMENCFIKPIKMSYL